jgi:hypothetical protein
VWNASKSYDTQATTKYAAGGEFAQYRDLKGDKFPVSGGTVMIGSKPVLLENAASAPAKHK